MDLITEVAVTNFRSLKSVKVDSLGNVSSFCGLNNSGKSNFLRCLNLFFLNQIEPGLNLVFDRDYHRAELQKKKRKLIRVSVSFNLPAHFRFRKGLSSAQTLLGRSFKISKEWQRNSILPQYFLNDSQTPLDPVEVQKVDNFLSLIAFRYIPNRVIPTDVIYKEHDALKSVLLRRLSNKRKDTGKVFEEINRVAQNFLGDLSSDFSKMVSPNSKLSLSTARSLEEIVLRFGYSINDGSIDSTEREQGSGIQSLLMFQTLYLIDQDYFQQFGWKQASIWAVEEPESSLHTALEAQVASFLHRTTRSPGNRLQIFLSTHSDLFLQYSDSCFIVNKANQDGSLSSIIEKEETKNAIKKAGRLGISRWINPILNYPLNPLLMVEGKFDRDFFNKANEVMGFRPRYLVICLEDLLDDPDRGGVEYLKKFLADNKEAIKTRAPDSPVIAFLDWDSAGKVSEFQKILGPSSHQLKCFAFDEKKANPNLGGSFRGIERFVSDRIISLLEQADNTLISTKGNGEKNVTPQDLSRAKKKINELILSSLEKADCHFIESALSLIKHFGE